MATIFLYIKLFFKLIIALLLLPFIIVYTLIKYKIFKFIFNRELRAYGINKNTAKTLSKELNMLLPHKFLN